MLNATGNNTAATESESFNVGELLLSSALAVAAGAAVALSMVLQRYALSYPTYRVPLLCCKLRRPVVWLLGLLLYNVGNVMFAAASLFGPISLLASLFTLLLVWNLIFARIVLREVLTAPKLLGVLLIIAGTALSVLGTPSDAPTEFRVSDIDRLVSRTTGIAFLASLVVGGVATALSVLWFERAYALTDEEEVQRMQRMSTLASVILSRGRSSIVFDQNPLERWQSAAETILRQRKPIHALEALVGAARCAKAAEHRGDAVLHADSSAGGSARAVLDCRGESSSASDAAAASNDAAACVSARSAKSCSWPPPATRFVSHSEWQPPHPPFVSYAEGRYAKLSARSAPASCRLAQRSADSPPVRVPSCAHAADGIDEDGQALVCGRSGLRDSPPLSLARQRSLDRLHSRQAVASQDGAAAPRECERAIGDPPGPTAPTALAAAFADATDDSKARGEGGAQARGGRRARGGLPPPWLDAAMTVVYPASLGLLEGVTQLAMKGSVSMITTCFQGEAEWGLWPYACWRSAALWSFAAMLLGVGALTIAWLKIVYTRYETTTALPIEYGTVHVGSVLGGLLFFRELEYMSVTQKTFSFVGLVVIVIGVAVSSRKTLRGASTHEAPPEGDAKGATAEYDHERGAHATRQARHNEHEQRQVIQSV